MNLVRIYQCLSDDTRLRILNLLGDGPLCVCHFQDALQLPQVKISKHLAYLRKHGVLCARRSENWMIYSFPSAIPPELMANLQCLQKCTAKNRVFMDDRKRLKKVLSGCETPEDVCCRKNNRKRAA